MGPANSASAPASVRDTVLLCPVEPPAASPCPAAVLPLPAGTFAPGRCSDRTRCLEGNSSTEPHLCAYHAVLAHAAAVSAFRQGFCRSCGQACSLEACSLECAGCAPPMHRSAPSACPLPCRESVPGGQIGMTNAIGWAAPYTGSAEDVAAAERQQVCRWP